MGSSRSGAALARLACAIAIALGLACAARFGPARPAWAQQPLVVDEWGTFTSFQDERGQAIVGINTDDEPLPDFVHSLHDDLIIGTSSQGASKCHMQVTMRLETPVLYFHPPAGAPPLTCDVRVEFRGGWLTQFY